MGVLPFFQRPWRDMSADVTAVVLAGGAGRRMGGRDKGLILWQGQPLVQHVLARITPQVASVLISANRNLACYRRFGHPVIHDHDFPASGPLGGIYNALKHCQSPYLLVVPCDTPLLPADLVSVLLAGLKHGQQQASVAYGHGRIQPTICLLNSCLLTSLADFLHTGQRRTANWLHSIPAAQVTVAPNALLNINQPNMLPTETDASRQAWTYPKCR